MLIGPLPQWRSRRRSSGEPSRLRWRRTLTSGRDWRDDEATTLARSTIVVDSYLWKVYPAGRITVYGKARIGTRWDRWVYGAPEAGLEPATRCFSEQGEPTSDGAAEATTGPEVPPVERPRREKSAPKPSPKPSPRRRRS